jgi:dTDP-glucose 4,6-dehydratase
MFAIAYARTYNLPVTLTRAANNYGPYQFPEKFVPLIISNAIEDRPLPLYGDGRQVREWLYVEDHCRALDMVLHRGRTGEAYNIGASSERTNVDVARTVLRLLGKPESLITFVADRPAHDRRYALECSRVHDEIGWKPLVGFEEGMARTVEWYRAHAEWVASVRGGAYREYYDRHYNQRNETLAAVLGKRSSAS